jgi:cell division protein FtsQ
LDKDKVIPLEDRLPQLKRERKQKANRRFAFYASLFFLLVLIVVYVQSPLSKINRIIVEGEQITARSDIVRASGLTANTHIWDIRSRKIADRVEQLRTIRSADVHTYFPNTVRIHVTEYGRKAYLSKGDRYYPILQNGAVLDDLPIGKLPTDAPILIHFTDKSALKAVSAGLSALPTQAVRNISDIHYQKSSDMEDNLLLYMNDGNRIIASTKTFSKNIKFYPKIIAGLPEGKKGTIHLSVGSYFVPYQQSGSNNK